MITARYNENSGINAGLLLSIITITKDDAEGLARTLLSTARWRAEAWVEQIVVDASRVPARVEDLRIRIERQTSSGIAAAFNEGLACANGEWVWFMNGGDAVHENLDVNWVFRLLSATRAHVVTGAIHCDGEDAPRALPPLVYQWPLIACWLSHPATLVRRQRLLALGGFSEKWRIAMDYDLWFRLLDRDTVVDVISVPFARFDVNGVSEHPDTAPLARWEDALVVLTHSGRMIGACGWLYLRLARRLGRAVFRRIAPVKENANPT